jgi:hypothetical protein
MLSHFSVLKRPSAMLPYTASSDGRWTTCTTPRIPSIQRANALALSAAVGLASASALQVRLF